MRATHIPDKDTFLTMRVAGSFRVVLDDGASGEATFWYCCPCGCRDVGPLSVGNGFKPSDSPSWEWNGSTDAPNLIPSVHHVGHWHGWLRDGIWSK